ncbi:PREDICTED: LOW QUALITY PROTEIN: uncharacterized protein LOC107355764 [Paramuricea clavata]|uniref:PREDICTED: LOW QUALITY PROTEIN: uncharacterized protein LOC107355764 n=1 Tax=Paramuricea clavata TaxID=317549 RepID=A0A6S7H5J8_PARCT|nr:PREDICTED: LOW QUALITY PROTEIN: uncharacterized protein LOC107355764 [Paramuricea clavata]
MDPEGTRLRQAHRLKRRNYINPGPNNCWHADGYDKLKPYGLPIHGCIDGFSRRVIWLKLEMSNNDPKVIGKLFRDAVIEVGGCPSILRTDRGTENGIMSSVLALLTTKHQYNPEDLEEINRELNPSDDSNESLIYQEYFGYVNEMLGITEPSSWRDALGLYHRLSTVAQT